MTIYRYELTFSTNTGGKYQIMLPRGAKVIDAVWQEKRNEFSVYAECDTERELEQRIFAVVGTGCAVPYGSTHIRSIVMPDGYHVFHVYEVT